MEFVPASNGVTYSIEMPRHLLRANTMWVSPLMRDKLPIAEEQRISALVNREAGALTSSLISISGRSLVARSMDFGARAGQPFDAVEISGFGIQHLIPIENSAELALVRLDQAIEIPNNINFYDNNPGVGSHQEVVAGARTEVAEDYAFSGAYTLEQAAVKVAIAKEAERVCRDAGYPVLVPVPLLIGRYDSIQHPERGNAYYTVSPVPYEGRRTGISQGQEEIGHMVSRGYASMCVAGQALRFMHDVMQVSHNSFILGNTDYEDDHKPLLIADWATAKQLNPRDANNHMHRANDLTSYFSGFIHTCTVLDRGRTDYKSLMGLTLQELMRGYFGVKVNLREYMTDSVVESLQTPAAFQYFSRLIDSLKARINTSMSNNNVKPMNFANVDATVKKILKIAT